MDTLKQILLYLLLGHDVSIKYKNKNIYITIKDIVTPNNGICFVYSLYNIHDRYNHNYRFINKKYISKINFNLITSVKRHNITGYWFNAHRNIILSKNHLNILRELINGQS